MELIKTPIIVIAIPWAVGALLITAAFVLLPLEFGRSKRMLTVLGLNVFITAPLATTILAASAARLVQTITERAGVGGVVGTGTLAGMMIGLTIMGAVAGSNPTLQKFVPASEPRPHTRVPYGRIVSLSAAATGTFSGLVLGAGNLLLAMLASIVVGAIH